MTPVSGQPVADSPNQTTPGRGAAAAGCTPDAAAGIYFLQDHHPRWTV